MKTIIINENIERKLFEMLINEGLGYSNKVNIIKNYLDKNFIKADIEQLNDKGDLEKQNIVIMLDSKKEPTEHRLTLEQLYYKLQYKFQNIISNKNERNQFIWNTINDWFNNKITKYNNLSKY
nr:hypothetical protein [Clostridia bacterium]